MGEHVCGPGGGHLLLQAVVVAHHPKRTRVRSVIVRDDHESDLPRLVCALVTVMARYVRAKRRPGTTWLCRVLPYRPGRVHVTGLT